MKKILSIAIVAILTVALCISASATLNVDRIFVNINDRPAGDEQFGATPPTAGCEIKMNAGDKLYTIGWAFSEGNLEKIVYTVNGGEDIECPDNYRDRVDVAQVLGIDAALGTHAGFGADTADAGGMLELAGVDRLTAGTYEIAIKAIYTAGEPETFEFTLVVEGELPEEPAPTSDAAVIVAASLGVVALGGVIIAKKKIK